METVEAAKPVDGQSNSLQWLGGGFSQFDTFLCAISSLIGIVPHYTDLGGFKGIIDAGDLWLTHLRFSNDNESSAAKDIVRQKLDERATIDPRNTRLLEATQRAARPTMAEIARLPLLRKERPQWRGYGANGAGVCIKFNKQRFSHLTVPKLQGEFCDSGKSFIRWHSSDASSTKLITDGSSGGADSEERAKRSAEAIQFFIPTFKNPDFAEEEEWRLTLPVKPAFRTGRNMLIPYYGSLGWGDAPLVTGVLCWARYSTRK